MSFGLSSGGGQVRYALIVDDQATAKLNTFKNSLTQLGTGTGKLSRDMTVLNNSFSAGVVPIKNTGNALNQLSNTQKTLGSQLATIGSGFKNNALAIGAAASSVLGLYQNYANLSSAQNAANKSATAAKAAQNSVTTAVKNLNKAIAENGANSKAAKDAQDKLTVARERLVNKTESAKIAQDNLNQTMADFGINILPNVLLAGGSVTSIFDNIGSKGKGLGGIIGKLSGAFGGLGGATGLLKGGMAGLLTTLGPLALALGGIAAALLYAKDTAEVASKAIEDFKAAAKLDDVTKSIQGMNAALDKLKLTPGIGSLKQIGDLIASLGAGGLRNNFVDQAKKMAENARMAASDIGKLAAAQKKLDDDEEILANKRKERQTTAVKNEVKHMEAVVADDKAEVARLKTIKQVNDLKTTSISLTQSELNVISRRNEAMAKARQQDIDVAAALGEVITKTKAAADDAKRQAEATTQLDTALNKTIPDVIRFTEGSGASANAMGLMNDMLKLSKDRMVEWAPPAGTVTQAMIDMVIHTNEAEESFKGLAKTMKNDLSKAAADAQSAIDKMRSGVQSGLDKIIEAFHKVHKKGKLDFEVNFDKAKKGYDKFLAEVGDKLDHGGSANAQKYILAFEKKGTEGMSKSQKRIFQPIFDWIEKHKDEPPTIFMSGFLQMLATYEPDVSQQFQKLLDPSIGLAGEIGKKAGAAFSKELMDAINSTLTIADRFKDVGGHPGRGSLKDTETVKIPTEFILPKIPIPSPKTPVKIPAVLVRQTNFNLASLWENSGKPQPPFPKGNPKNKNLKDEPFRNEFTPTAEQQVTAHQMRGHPPKKFIPGWQNLPMPASFGGGKSSNAAPQINIEMALKQIDMIAKRIIDLAKIIPVITVNNAKALQAAGVIALNINNLSQIAPILQVVNSKALKAVGVVAQNIQNLDKLKPVMQIVNSKALKAVGVVAQHIDDLAKLKPTLQIVNSKALKAVGVIAQHIMDLEKLNPTVTVHVKTVGGAISAQKGLHAYLLEDTTIMAHKGERVDIGHGSEGKGGGVTFNNMGGGGSGGGTTIIENHIHIGDENLLRKFTARSGKNRFTMGM